jgi:SAM-dependent methyltransferase
VTGSEFAYTGCDNLEVMAEAVNYNRFLVDSVDRYVTGPSERVLDFGAGAGTYADMLGERGIKPDCLEPDRDLQGVLQAKGYEVVDLDEVSASADRYDVIYTLNVLEHIKNDQEAAEQLASLLAPGGKLVIYVPAFEILFTSMDVKVEHFRRYRRANLNRILRNAGLEIVESRYCDPLGFFATLAYKVLGRADGTINPGALKLYDRVVFPVSKALQSVFGRVFGKNVLVVATLTR